MEGSTSTNVLKYFFLFCLYFVFHHDRDRVATSGFERTLCLLAQVHEKTLIGRYSVYSACYVILKN